GHGFFEELHRDEVAERVGGEVAEVAGTPEHVLQHAEAVFGNVEAEVSLEFSVPGGGRVLDGQAGLQQVELELEAQQEEEVVGHFVGFDANERGLHLVERAKEVFGADARELFGEGGLHARVEVVPEGAAAAH